MSEENGSMFDRRFEDFCLKHPHVLETLRAVEGTRNYDVLKTSFQIIYLNGRTDQCKVELDYQEECNDAIRRVQRTGSRL